MDKKFTSYCGLYCENCAVKARLVPASKVLYEEMIKAGFEMPLEPLKTKYVPTKDILNKCFDFGRELAAKSRSKVLV